jgi:hypothetical protein
MPSEAKKAHVVPVMELFSLILQYLDPSINFSASKSVDFGEHSDRSFTGRISVSSEKGCLLVLDVF